MRTSRLLPWLMTGLALSVAGCGDDFTATGGGGEAGTTATGGKGGGGTGGAGGQATTGGTGGGGAAPACSPLKADDCNQCLATECAGTYCECTGSSDCLGLLECIAKGGANPAPGYYELCAQQHGPSISLAGNLAVCSHDKCPVCGTPKVDDCVACEYANCPDEVNGCLSSYQCNGYIACLRDCANMGNPSGCTETCKDTHADGVPLYEALVGCATDSCQASCL